MSFLSEEDKFVFLRRNHFKCLPIPWSQPNPPSKEPSLPSSLTLSVTSDVVLIYQNQRLIRAYRGKLEIQTNPIRIAGIPDQLEESDQGGDLKILGELQLKNGNLPSLRQELVKIETLLDPHKKSKNSQETHEISSTTLLNKVLAILKTQPEPSLQEKARRILKPYQFFATDVSLSSELQVFAGELEKFDWLHRQGFDITPQSQQFLSYLKRAKEYAQSGEFPIDGMVFTFNDNRIHEPLGYTAHHPRYRMAFKWQGEEQPTQIVDIVWEVSRTGLVTPIACLEPVK